jgi:hypothetical protein
VRAGYKSEKNNKRVKPPPEGFVERMKSSRRNPDDSPSPKELMPLSNSDLYNRRTQLKAQSPDYDEIPEALPQSELETEIIVSPPSAPQPNTG